MPCHLAGRASKLRQLCSIHRSADMLLLVQPSAVCLWSKAHHPAVRDGVCADDLAGSISLELLCDHHVCRQQQLDAPLLGCSLQLPACSCLSLAILRSRCTLPPHPASSPMTQLQRQAADQRRPTHSIGSSEPSGTNLRSARRAWQALPCRTPTMQLPGSACSC